MYRRALVIMEKCSGSEDPQIIDALDNLAEMLSAAGRTEEAMPISARADAIRLRRKIVKHQRSK